MIKPLQTLKTLEHTSTYLSLRTVLTKNIILTPGGLRTKWKRNRWLRSMSTWDANHLRQANVCHFCFQVGFACNMALLTMCSVGVPCCKTGAASVMLLQLLHKKTVLYWIVISWKTSPLKDWNWCIVVKILYSHHYIIGKTSGITQNMISYDIYDVKMGITSLTS